MVPLMIPLCKKPDVVRQNMLVLVCGAAVNDSKFGDLVLALLLLL
jgi:hypothetical protein